MYGNSLGTVTNVFRQEWVGRMTARKPEIGQTVLVPQYNHNQGTYQHQEVVVRDLLDAQFSWSFKPEGGHQGGYHIRGVTLYKEDWQEVK